MPAEPNPNNGLPGLPLELDRDDSDYSGFEEDKDPQVSHQNQNKEVDSCEGNSGTNGHSSVNLKSWPIPENVTSSPTALVNISSDCEEDGDNRTTPICIDGLTKVVEKPGGVNNNTTTISVIYTDASDMGWGAHAPATQTHPEITMSGFWTPHMQQARIEKKELTAAAQCTKELISSESSKEAMYN